MPASGPEVTNPAFNGNFSLLCSDGDSRVSGTFGSSFGDAVPLVSSGNLWIDAMAGELAHVGIDPRNLIRNSEEKVESDESDLASLVLAADGQLQMLHRQTREARARDSSNLEPEYKLKLEAALEQVFVLSKSLVADVGHQAVQILTELKTLKDHNVLLVDQLSNVEGKVDSLVIKASAEPRPEHLHPDLIKTLSGVKSLSESVAKHLTGLEKKVDGLKVSTEPQPRPDQHQPHPDLVKQLSDLKSKIDGLVVKALAESEPRQEQSVHPDLVKSLSGLQQKVEKLHPDLVKSLTDLKSKVDGLVAKASTEPQPRPEQQQHVHPDLVESLSDLKLSSETVVAQLAELKEQQSKTNQSLSQQVADSNAELIKKFDKVEQALKDSMDADRLDECIRETVGDKPVFLQWMEWMRNLWYSEVPKHSHLWHPQASQGSI